MKSIMDYYNIYCDESCHLKSDKSSKIMGIAGLVCPNNKVKEVRDEINEIKKKYNISKNIELKWTKISSSKKQAYLDIVNLFFRKKYLHFRIVLVDKTAVYDQNDEFYYKICYLLLSALVKSKSSYNIYLDKKDTLGGERVNVLRKCLKHIKKDYDAKLTKIKNVQNIQSHEVAIMQMLDILLGAVVYYKRGLKGVLAKMDIIKFIKQETGLTLDKTTPLYEQKFNILYFKSSELNEKM